MFAPFDVIKLIVDNFLHVNSPDAFIGVSSIVLKYACDDRMRFEKEIARRMQYKESNLLYMPSIFFSIQNGRVVVIDIMPSILDIDWKCIAQALILTAFRLGMYLHLEIIDENGGGIKLFSLFFIYRILEKSLVNYLFGMYGIY
ncbi:hypothetical protein ACJX0J_030210, partial [Zea mays]